MIAEIKSETIGNKIEIFSQRIQQNGRAMKSKSKKIMISGNKCRLSSIWMIIPERENWEARGEKIIRQVIFKCLKNWITCVSRLNRSNGV